MLSTYYIIYFILSTYFIIYIIILILSNLLNIFYYLIYLYLI